MSLARPVSSVCSHSFLTFLCINFFFCSAKSFPVITRIGQNRLSISIGKSTGEYISAQANYRSVY